MASPLTILKIVLNLNHKCMQITGCDEKTVTVHRFGEAYKQTRIYAYAKPYSCPPFQHYLQNVVIRLFCVVQRGISPKDDEYYNL